MTVTTLTSREFNQDTSGAKKAASQGPVFITDRGRPAHVLLTMENYLRLTGGHMSLADQLAPRGFDAIVADDFRAIRELLERGDTPGAGS